MQACDGHLRLQCGVWKLKDFQAAASAAASVNVCVVEKILLPARSEVPSHWQPGGPLRRYLENLTAIL